ncbi:MAG: orotidine-5'-phosphate decarboxylase [Candidatus Aenigmarchaeota archaeon]|nr:orotidine-5'-phosphate decarboxylase [Candidatus Aenigmarchaeota archaeon]
MGFLEILEKSAYDAGNIACFGLDPVAEKIPIKGGTEGRITAFYTKILDAMAAADCLPAAVKPNLAFYEQYGLDGLLALKNVMQQCRKLKLPVILDAKRGDIDKSSAAYAKAIFGHWAADAVTVNPFLGHDSVLPFLEYCRDGKGVYILARTSNKGALDFQDLKIGSQPLFMEVARKILAWHVDGIGAVVGATEIEELQRLAAFFADGTKPVALLVPGVGAQGGQAKDVMKVLAKSGTPWLHRINSSSAIAFAYEHTGKDDYAGAAVTAMKALAKETKFS